MVELQRHPFYNGVDWAALAAGTLTPPEELVPIIRDVGADTSRYTPTMGEPQAPQIDPGSAGWDAW
jgi:hypothetical protein